MPSGGSQANSKGMSGVAAGLASGVAVTSAAGNEEQDTANEIGEVQGKINEQIVRLDE